MIYKKTVFECDQCKNIEEVHDNSYGGLNPSMISVQMPANLDCMTFNFGGGHVSYTFCSIHCLNQWTGDQNIKFEARKIEIANVRKANEEQNLKVRDELNALKKQN